jgi:hypothetical protein
LCAIVKCVKIEHSYFDYVSRETYMKVLCIADSTRVCNCSRVLPSNARTYMFQTNDKWRLVKFQLGLLSETINAADNWVCISIEIATNLLETPFLLSTSFKQMISSIPADELFEFECVYWWYPINERLPEAKTGSQKSLDKSIVEKLFFFKWQKPAYW